MAYESRHLRRAKVRYDDANDDNPLTFQLIKNGAKLTPVSATVAVYTPGGTAALTATSATVSGTLLTYALDTTTEATFPLGNGYRAHWVITVGSTTYPEDQIFDVVRLVPFGRIGRDQLIAADDRVKAMEHNGDEDFSEIIEAARDEVQLDVETKVLGDEQLMENMILDQSRLAIPARFLVLAYIFHEKGMPADGERYEAKYKEKIREVLSGIRYDKDEDGEEDTKQGGVQIMRLVT